jgi:exopolysaccharide biosynthesis predicted pyruvyltransferase EpsI
MDLSDKSQWRSGPAGNLPMNLREQSRLPPTGVDAILIWPRAGNAGDRLIADACERYLHDRAVEVWRSDGSIEQAAAAGDSEYLGDLLGSFRGMLLFSGGGNIGIYPDNAEVRAAVISRAGPRHRCLVFPQSALAPEPALLDPRVTVWCRDAVSQIVLQQAGTQTALVPDVSLYMDDVIAKKPQGRGLFYVRRTPGGDSETIDHHIVPECPAEDLTVSRPLDRIVSALDPYEVVISDRLHGALIAAMMRKKVVLLPVGYHKNRSFYETWLRSRPGFAFVETQDELTAKLAGLQPPNADLQALFLEHADPALNRFLLDF